MEDEVKNNDITSNNKDRKNDKTKTQEDKELLLKFLKMFDDLLTEQKNY